MKKEVLKIKLCETPNYVHGVRMGAIFSGREIEVGNTNVEELAQHAEKMLRYYGCTEETRLYVYLSGQTLFYTAMLVAVRNIGCKRLQVGSFVPVCDMGFYQFYQVPVLPKSSSSTAKVVYDAMLQAGTTIFDNEEMAAFERLGNIEGMKKEEFIKKIKECPCIVSTKVAIDSEERKAAIAAAEKEARQYTGKRILLVGNCHYSKLVIAVNALLKQGCKIIMYHITKNGEKVCYQLT